MDWESVTVGPTCNSSFGPVGAPDGSLIFDCSGTVRVLAANSKTVGPPRAIAPAAVENYRMEGIQSAKEFVLVADGTDEAGRTVSSWFRTVDGGVTWRAPVRFPDAFPGYANLVTVAGGLLGISTDKAALQFSLDGGTTWQSRTF